MDVSRNRLLVLFLVVFGVVVGLLVWKFVFDATAFFKPGTRAAIELPGREPPRQPPIRPTDPSRGSENPEAPTIVEFADFTCQYCRASEPGLVDFLRANPNVKHVWRDLPVVSDRPDAILAASAARCAQEQGRFWDMHNALMNASTLTLENVQEIGRTLRLDSTSFNTCVTSGKYVTAIQDDINLALQHGITSAPTFFIGNQVIEGYADAGDFRWAFLKARF